MTPGDKEALQQAISALATLFGNAVGALSVLTPSEGDKLMKDALNGRDFRLQLSSHLRGAAARKRAARLRLEATREDDKRAA